MSFTNYAGTPFAPWLLPIIPADATLSEHSTLTVDDLGKIPGLKRSAVWAGFHDWDGMGAISNVDKQRKLFAVWDSWYIPPQVQTIGVRGRLFPAADIDISDPTYAQIAQNCAERVFGSTIVRGRSNSGKRLLMYRLDEGKTDFIHKVRRVYQDPDGNEFKVEILGKGQQYLIEGMHPSGVPYEWVDGRSPLTVEFEELPRITVEKVNLFIQELDGAMRMFGCTLVRGHVSRGHDPNNVSEINENHPEKAPSLEALSELLSYIPCSITEFEDYESWETSCRAIKTACGGDEDFYDKVFLPWCEANGNDADYVRQKWDSHRNSSVGWRWLCEIAHGYGYTGDIAGLFEPLEDDDDTARSSGPGEGPVRHRGPVPKPMPENFALYAMPRRPFVLGHRFMAGAVTLGVGAPGAGKSNLAILTALSIATGQPLTGEEVHKTGPVWIHNNEDSLDELHRRVGGMMKSLGIDFNEVRRNILMSSGLDERLIVAFKSKDIVKRTEAVADVVASIKEQGIIHMVIDPLVSTHLGVSENSNEEIEQVIGTIQHIAHETGCSIDLVHHSLKSHSDNTEAIAGDMNAARGASSLIGAARMVYTLAPMSKKTAEEKKLDAAQAARLVRLDHGKGNYAPRETNTRWFKLEPFDIGNGSCNFDTDALPVRGDTIAVPKPWDPPANREKVPKAVQKSGKLQEVRNLVAGAMSTDRCRLTDLLSAIGKAFDVKSSAARARLMDAIPEGAEVTAEAAEQVYLLKLDRVKPVPPGRLYVLRRIFDQEAEAA